MRVIVAYWRGMYWNFSTVYYLLIITNFCRIFLVVLNNRWSSKKIQDEYWDTLHEKIFLWRRKMVPSNLYFSTSYKIVTFAVVVDLIVVSGEWIRLQQSFQAVWWSFHVKEMMDRNQNEDLYRRPRWFERRYFLGRNEKNWMFFLEWSVPIICFLLLNACFNNITVGRWFS